MKRKFGIIFSVQDIKSCRASGGTNRVEHHGGIGEIRDVSERIGKTVPGELSVVLNKVDGRFLLRGIVPLDVLDQKEKTHEPAAVE